MDRAILFKLVGLLLLVIGVFALIAGLLIANKFMQGTGFISVVIAGMLLYYSMNVTPADKPDMDEEKPFDESALAKTTIKK